MTAKTDIFLFQFTKLKILVTTQLTTVLSTSVCKVCFSGTPALVTVICSGWVNKYLFIHSQVSCPVHLSRSLFLHYGVIVEEEEENRFYCCLHNLNTTFRILLLYCLYFCQVFPTDSPSLLSFLECFCHLSFIIIYLCLAAGKVFQILAS